MRGGTSECMSRVVVGLKSRTGLKSHADGTDFIQKLLRALRLAGRHELLQEIHGALGRGVTAHNLPRLQLSREDFRLLVESSGGRHRDRSPITDHRSPITSGLRTYGTVCEDVLAEQNNYARPPFSMRSFSWRRSSAFTTFSQRSAAAGRPCPCWSPCRRPPRPRAAGACSTGRRPGRCSRQSPCSGSGRWGTCADRTSSAF